MASSSLTGFGYVSFSSPAEAQKAVETMNGKEIDGRAVNVDISTPRTPNPASRAKAFGDAVSEESKVLFVGNVSFGADEDTLWSAFGEYGDVVSVRYVFSISVSPCEVLIGSDCPRIGRRNSSRDMVTSSLRTSAARKRRLGR